MCSKRCVLVFVLGMLCSVLGPTAAAQNVPVLPSSCFVYISAHDLGVDMGAAVPPEAVLVNQNTVPGEGGLSIYQLPLWNCAPPGKSLSGFRILDANAAQRRLEALVRVKASKDDTLVTDSHRSSQSCDRLDASSDVGP